MTDSLRQLAQEAMGFSISPSSASIRVLTWTKDGGGCRVATDPECRLWDAYIKALDAVDKARKQLKLRDERVHIAVSGGSAATRTEALMSNGRDTDEGWDALRASLAALEGMTP